MAERNNYPKLHNAAWPGVVGKGTADAEPIIPLDTLLELTANAEADGGEIRRYRSLARRSSYFDRQRRRSDQARRRPHCWLWAQGRLICCAHLGRGRRWFGDGPARRSQTLCRQVEKAAIGKRLRDLGVRRHGVVRINSAASLSEWDKDPVGNTKKIAKTFREACKAASATMVNVLLAEGEICWGGMHLEVMLESARRRGCPRPRLPGGHGAYAALTRSATTPKMTGCFPRIMTGRQGRFSTKRYKKMTDALRPWTIDFHVAQNDGTVFGSGYHDKTGHHCLVTIPTASWISPKHAGLLAARRQRRTHQAASGISAGTAACSRMRVMDSQQTWNDVLAAMIKVRDKHGWEFDGACTWPRRNLNVGMIGYGFMGRAHSNAYRKVNNFFDLEYQPVLKAVCARSECRKEPGFRRQLGLRIDRDRLAQAASSARTSTSSTSARPNNTHAEIAIAAAQAGKMILCEKPLAMNGAEGEKMVEAVEKAKVPNMVWYNYRRVPAVTLAKQLIDEGKLGRIFHYRAKFLQDWTISPDLPQGGAGPVAARRRRRPAAASPAICSPTASTPPSGSTAASTPSTAMTETFVKERKHNLTGKVEKVGIDDACAFLARFDNGSLATFEVDALRPRPQGALHLRDQRRACVDRLGPARPASAAILRSPRRRPAARLALDPRHRRRSSLHGQLVGARACRSATSTPSSTRSPTSSTASAAASRRPRLPRCAATHYVCDAVLDSAKSGHWETGSRADADGCRQAPYVEL